MPVLQASRRLVKSPPELWAEVSDAASLARHLGEVGEITITRLEPETTVAWEGERASGTVELAPAGWGTSVTLTAEPRGAAAEPDPEPEPASATELADAPHAAAPEPPAPEPAAEPDPAAAVEPEPAEITPVAVAEAEPTEITPVAVVEPEATETAPEPATQATPEPPAPLAEAEPADDPAAPAPTRRSWLTRLLRRRPPKAAETSETEPANADRAGGAGEDDSATPLAESPRPVTGPARSSAEPEPVAPTPEPEPEPEPDPLEQALTSALDSLGSAHHRPFSRG